jgi:hypothetical protein
MRGTSVWEQKPEWVSGLDRGDQRLKPRGRDWAATSAQAQYGTGSNPSTHSTSDYTRSTGTYVPPYVVTNRHLCAALCRHQSEQHPARQFQHQWQLQSQHRHKGHPHAAAAARMSVIDQIKNGKANVKTNLLPDGSIRISALETIEAMEHLQWIAEEAIGAAQLSGRYLLPIPTVGGVVTILS